MAGLVILVEQLRSDVLRAMNNGADFGLHRVEDQMGLEAETAIARGDFIHLLADEGEVGKKSEGADQAGVVGFSLIFAEPALGEVVDVDQIGSGAFR